MLHVALTKEYAHQGVIYFEFLKGIRQRVCKLIQSLVLLLYKLFVLSVHCFIEFLTKVWLLFLNVDNYMPMSYSVDYQTAKQDCEMNALELAMLPTNEMFTVAKNAIVYQGM